MVHPLKSEQLCPTELTKTSNEVKMNYIKKADYLKKKS